MPGGAEQPIKTSQDANLWLRPGEWTRFLATLGSNSAKLAANQALLQGRGTWTVGSIYAAIGQDIAAKTPGVEAKTGVAVAPVEYKPVTLEEVNEIQAAEYAAGMPFPVVNDFAARQGMVPTATENEKRAVFMAAIYQWANAAGVVLSEWIAEHERNPNADPYALGKQTVVPQGSGKTFFEQVKFLARHPLAWARRVFQTEPGKIIRNIGREILRLGDQNPLLNKLFLSPLGFKLQAQFLYQAGRALIDGDIETFDETKFAKAAAGTLTDAGQALIVASAFLPPPWNAAALALGTLSKAVGDAMTKAISQAENRRALREYNEKVKAAFEAEKAKREAAASGYQQQWGWFGSKIGYLWTAFLRDGSRLVPVWVSIPGRGWVALRQGA